MEEAYNDRLVGFGMTLEEFVEKKAGYDAIPTEERKYEKAGFSTTTRKAEIHSTVLEKLGYDPLPHYEEPPESPVSTPEMAEEFPLILITGGRFLPMYHSEHRQIDSLRRHHPNPLLEINPETARQLGFEDGDKVWIETPRGRIWQRCRYFEGIDPRVVHIEHGWWFPELPGEEPWLHGVWESNADVITDDDPKVCNKKSGGWPLRGSIMQGLQAKGALKQPNGFSE